MRLQLRPQYLYVIESAFIGVFFIQALRFLIGMLYSRVAGAAVFAVSDPAAIDAALPGLADPAVVQTEVSFLLYMLALPLLTLVAGRFRFMLVVSAVVVAFARTLMAMDLGLAPTIPASLAVGAGLFHVALLARHRATALPYFFIAGLSIDQLFRAFGNTFDPSWLAEYLIPQIVTSVLAVVFSVAALIWQRRAQIQRADETDIDPDKGLLPSWGGIGIGALLFLELSLLALPNAVQGRADVDYTTFVPLIMAATLLPTIPYVRMQARGFISLFDGSVRGWVWMVLIALLIVFGTRFPGIGGGVALVIAQFAVSMMWWWLVRPQAEKERNISGLWLILAVFMFAVLTIGDFFTFEYAFVRDFTGNFAFLNDYVPPLMRGFRGMGLGVLLLAVFLAAIPMTQTNRRIPWGERRPRSGVPSLIAAVVVIGFSAAAAVFARPPLIQGVTGVDTLRVGTYNIHAGFNEFFYYDLEAIAQTIDQSGAKVVLIQEAEVGRMTSFGVDQPLWLARRLRMDRRFYATNEGMQGLAVLSEVPIVFDEGIPLSSVANATGVQRVQVSTDGVSAITFYNTWLGLLLDLRAERTLEQQEQNQQRQLSEIVAKIAADHPDGVLGRTVIGGTYNNVPDSPLVTQMRAIGFSDPFAGLPLELSATLWRTNIRAQVDYLWLRNLTPLGAIVMDGNASDHRMAVADVIITR
jgi:endonuclease/exonuclease/phosphatase family metal-dependent hydrolase